MNNSYVQEQQLLKIAAHTQEEVQILSAHIQDSILPASCIQWSPQDHILTMLLTRFCWERKVIVQNNKQFYERVHSALYIAGIEDANLSELNNLHPSHILSILTLTPESDTHLKLTFSKHIHIDLKGKNLKCYLKDLNDPYVTEFKPQHA